MSKLRNARREDAQRLISKAATRGDLHLIAELSAALETRRSSESASSLTILTNDAGHLVPEELIIGDFFIASKGSFDVSSSARVERKYISILKRTHKKLTSKRYRSVFMIPTGPVTLNMQLKALVRDILRVHTVDYAYFDGRYLPIAVNFRRDVYG